MIAVLLKTFPFFAIAMFGFASIRWRLMDESGVKGLSRFVMFLALPALLFNKLATSSASSLLNGQFLFAYVVAVMLAFATAALLGQLIFRGGFSQAALFGLAGTYGNIGFLGIPLLSVLAGDWIAIPLAIILTFDLVVLVPLASAAVKYGKSRNQMRKGSAPALFSAILCNPLILAIAAGILVALTGLPLPQTIVELSALLSKAAAPCAMFVVGAVLADKKTSSSPFEAIYMTVFKLLAFPIIVWTTIGFLGVEDEWRMAATLGAAMPAAAVLTVVADEHDVLPSQASMAVLISTILSILTISVGLAIT